MLIYWHDMWLPHSRFLVEELHQWPGARQVTICGPAIRRGAASIFAVESAPRSESAANGREVKTKSYRWRETICTLREWKRIIKCEQPDILVICDEALSLNVFIAGVANFLYGSGLVLFYAFENIVQRPTWTRFRLQHNMRAFRALTRSLLRTIVVDRMLMPVRRKIVHGGLVSYEECRTVIRCYNWDPFVMKQWWPVDTDVFTRNGSRREFVLDAEFVVGFVGRFVSEKGVFDLLSALQELDEDVALVLIGDGPEKNMLARESARRGLSRRVRILPPQNSQELASSFRAMDLVILPSRPTDTWKEQYGRVLVEARLCGTRIAGSDVGAIPIVVGEPDMIFPAGNAREIANTVRRARLCITGEQQEFSPPTCKQFMAAWLDVARSCQRSLKT